MSKSRADRQPNVEQQSSRPASSDRDGGAYIVDPRPEAIAQRQLRDRIDGSARMAAQRSNPYTGRLPARLGAGIEALSGLSMSHVKIHYDSLEPARLNALAYARGSEIHLGPGQERHLPHEAWHLVQQAQGRVGSTGSMAGVALNDSAGLEREADVMGTRALHNPAPAGPRASEGRTSESHSSSGSASVVQRVTAVGANVQTPHVLVGPAQVSDEQPVNLAAHGERPILIEVMEGNANPTVARDAAIAKIDAIHASASNEDNRGIMIALNRRAAPGDIQDHRLRASRTFGGAYAPLAAAATAVATHAENNNVQAGCYPSIWAPTGDGDGYIFPFLEMRAQVTLHPGTAEMLRRMRAANVGDPIMRSMDGDVSDDPLLNNSLSGLDLSARKALEDIGRVAHEDRQVDGEDILEDFSGRGSDIVTGGYKWDTSAKNAAFWGVGFVANGATWNARLAAVLDLINEAEHEIRGRYSELLPKSIYWPEPNTYMDYRKRLEGAAVTLAAGNSAGDNAQQRESTFYIKDTAIVGRYDRSLQTTKPLKDYFGPLRDMIKRSTNEVIPKSEVTPMVETVRQSHFSPAHIQHIIQWNGGAITDGMKSSLELLRINLLSRVAAEIVTALRT